MFREVVCLIVLFKQIIGNPICGQKKFDNIFINEIYVSNNKTYSSVDIIIDKNSFRWDLQSQTIYEPVRSESDEKARIFIPKLPSCLTNSDDCLELNKLSNIGIKFNVSGYQFNYEFFKFVSNKRQSCVGAVPPCELPWNMSAQGNPSVDTKYNLWPKKWINQVKSLAAYDPGSHQLIYIIETTDQFDFTKILKKSLLSNDWSKDWESSQLSFKYSFVGMTVLMAIDDNGIPIINNMNRIFAFKLEFEKSYHRIYEYESRADRFIQSSYNYNTLLKCPEPEGDSSLPIVYIIGLSLLLILILMIFLGLFVYYFCSLINRKSTKITGKRSSSQDRLSSESITNLKLHT